MEIDRYTSPLLSSNMYVVSEGGRCIIIDPYFSPEAKGLLSGLTLDFMLVTHEQYDHVSGVNGYKAEYKIPLYASRACDEGMQSPARNRAKFFGAWLEVQGLSGQRVDQAYVCCADEIVEEGQTIDWMGHHIVLRLAPGHSTGSALILLDGDTLFSGDCMLRKSVPASRLPGSDPEAFQRSTLPQLKQLDGNMLVLPGHYGCFRLRDHHLLQVDKKERD